VDDPPLPALEQLAARLARRESDFLALQTRLAHLDQALKNLDACRRFPAHWIAAGEAPP
jgi:hypothetical protein